MSSEPGKQYGLLLPKKCSSQDVIQRPSIFDERSDSEESGPGDGDWVKKAYQREATKTAEKRQTKIQIQKALSQDSSIYQYDEVYDDMKEKVNKTAPKKEERKQSRYIQSLKRNAERRKLENERRMERQVQKERQEEGEEFKDKETFVTSSYKKKLEEFQKMDEEEKQIDRLEEIGDVSKQKDISGFYRHLYKTTVDVEHPQNVKVQDTKKEQEEIVEFSISKSPTKEFNKGQVEITYKDEKQKRQYRKRTKSGSSREEGEKTSSSSSSSSSSASSESEDEPKSKQKKCEKDYKNENRDKKIRSKSQGTENNLSLLKSLGEIGEDKKKRLDVTTDSVKIKGETKSETLTDVKCVVQETKQSVNIWLKRTVGANFDNALQRFLERKSKRQGSY